MSETKNFKINDRVKRLNGEGALGVVLEVREELGSAKSETAAKSLLVQVKWDNGTVSFLDPTALDLSSPSR